jgi:sterol desaturase/sphingolipid hydroxylase (fatty acid hydroxylase superfamily)
MLGSFPACNIGLQTYCILLGSYLGSCIPFEIIDRLKIYEDRKIQSNVRIGNDLKILAARMVTINFLWLIVVLYFVSPLLEIVLDMTSNMPSLLAFAMQISLSFVVDDAWFYCYHRYLHSNNSIYVQFHKPHHGTKILY